MLFGSILTKPLFHILIGLQREALGQEVYLALKERGVLVRHFSAPRIRDYNRITIGTREQMEIFLAKTKEILEEAAK